jgi:hypothetical protein
VAVSRLFGQTHGLLTWQIDAKLSYQYRLFTTLSLMFFFPLSLTHSWGTKSCSDVVSFSASFP